MKTLFSILALAALVAAVTAECDDDPTLESGCGNGCAKNCQNKDLSQAQISRICQRDQCQPGKCQCRSGLYFNNRTSNCVKKSDCPS